MIFIPFAVATFVGLGSLSDKPGWSDYEYHIYTIYKPMLIGGFLFGCFAVQWWPIALINCLVFFIDSFSYFVIGISIAITLAGAYLGSVVIRKVIFIRAQLDPRRNLRKMP